MGGKNRISKELLPFLLENMTQHNTYVEPFAGGCNMLDKVPNRERIANDINPYLIRLWEALCSGWRPSHVSKDTYEHIKLNKEIYQPHVVGWAGIGCSFRGKFFSSYAGVTKTKGGTRNYQAEALRNVLKQLPNLKGVKFSYAEYFGISIPFGSVVYCDPPYANTTGYQSKFDHGQFWEWCRHTAINNFVYVSEYSAPDDFECVWSKDVGMGLANMGEGQKTVTENLFTYNPPGSWMYAPRKAPDMGILQFDFYEGLYRG